MNQHQHLQRVAIPQDVAATASSERHVQDHLGKYARVQRAAARVIIGTMPLRKRAQNGWLGGSFAISHCTRRRSVALQNVRISICLHNLACAGSVIDRLRVGFISDKFSVDFH